MNSEISIGHIPKLDIKEKIPEILKKKSLIFFSALLLIFVFSFIIFSLPHSSSASKMVDKFENSINKGDISSLMEIMTTNNFDAELSELQVTNFKDYLLKNTDTFNSLISDLKKESHNHDADITHNSYYNKASMAYIAKVDEDYKVVVNTSNITITLPSKNYTDSIIDDIEFSIDGTKCEHQKIANGTYRINSLLPAKYKITASINNQYLSCEDSASIDIFKNYQSSTSPSKISLFNDQFKSVQLSTNAESATLYINNKKVREFTDGTTLAPVTKDMKIYAMVTDSNNSKLKSSTVQWNGTSKNLSLNFDDNLLSSISSNGDELLKKNMTKLLEDYSKNYEKFISNKSYKSVSSYIHPGSSFESQQKEYLTTLKGQNIKYKFVSCEVTNLKINTESKEILATVNSVYDTTLDKEDTGTEYFTHKYKLTYNEKSKKYLISEIIY